MVNKKFIPDQKQLTRCVIFGLELDNPTADCIKKKVKNVHTTSDLLPSLHRLEKKGLYRFKSDDPEHKKEKKKASFELLLKKAKSKKKETALCNDLANEIFKALIVSNKETIIEEARINNISLEELDGYLEKGLQKKDARFDILESGLPSNFEKEKNIDNIDKAVTKSFKKILSP